MDTIIFPGEAESYVESLQVFSIEAIGSQQWTIQHERIEKLNQQAVASATCQSDEYIREYLVTHEKIPVLIHNAIVTEVWKENVLPHLVKQVTPHSSFQLYMMMYHEAPLMTLLETLMYHSDVVEAAEDKILDLLDYCYRKTIDTLAKDRGDGNRYGNHNDPRNFENFSNNPEKDLERQKKDLDFCLGAKAVTIIRYISEHLSCLSLSVTQRILNNLDIPAILVHLVVESPWTAITEKGNIYKFCENEWRRVEEGDCQLTKTEAQVWIALYHLLMDPKCQEKYEISGSRKTQLLKLRSFINEIVLDQIPILAEMQRYLEHLAIMDPPANYNKDILIEQVPEIYNILKKSSKGKWKIIATNQLDNYLSGNEEVMRQQAKRWVETYNFDIIENLVAPPKCVVCGEQAAKRCSNCHHEWYCRRECQVKHWGKHKTVCDLLKKEPEAL